ncbi:FHA domain-containing protein [Nocardioidaceae bacterium]|nr:FHA domain-containing protein [Nocardioidaceae bacterium]
MRISTLFDGVRHEVDLVQHADAATLADLLESVTGSRPVDGSTLWVDDREVHGEDRIAELGLLEGCRLGQEPLPRPVTAEGWTLTVVGGLATGQVVELPTDRTVTVGRAPQADVTLDSASASWQHVTLRRESGGVRVRDAGSTNGTRVDGELLDPDQDGVLVAVDAVVVAGGAALRVRRSAGDLAAPRPAAGRRTTAAATVPFNRPPRDGAPPPPAGIEPPTRSEPTKPSRFSIATVIGPLLLAAAMVAVIGDPRFALLAALSPILGVGTWWEGKRRYKRDTEEERVRFEKALDDFEDELAAAASRERDRRRVEAPDPPECLRRAALPATTLWQRRPERDDFLVLHAGVGDVPWEPPIDRSGRASVKLEDEAAEIVARSRIGGAPVQVDLLDAGVVGIVGDREGALALARSLLCQATVHCGPADLAVGVFCDPGRSEDWDFAGWLPHTRQWGGQDGAQWLSAEKTGSERMLRSLLDTVDGLPSAQMLLVLDSEVLLEGRDAPARTLLGHGRGARGSSQRNPGTPVAGIVVAATEEQLPAACTVVVTVAQDAAATVEVPGDLVEVADVVLAGLDVESARRCAMDLAHFEDPELKVPGAGLPGMVRLNSVLGLDEPSVDAVLQRWDAATGVSTPVGVGESGEFEIDLVRDGPHGLVGGTTGSGKSEFLRSLVAGLALRTPPTELTFILIDFKGGAAFAACERLPHTIGTVSNLDAALADRAIRALEAEMRYRQELFAAAGEGVDNLDEYRRTNPAEPLPRLLLVIDEFAQLAKDYPDALASLVSVGAVGRTLGVHMILATQRPAGVVNDDILANTNLRVALRVQSKEDSVNVVDVPDASAISRTQQGRAYIKMGQDDIAPVQTALVTGQFSETETSAVEVADVVFGGVRRTASGPAKPDKDTPTDLDELIEVIRTAAQARGHVGPRPVWPPALGEQVPLAGLPGGPVANVAADGTFDGAEAERDADLVNQVPPRAVGRMSGRTLEIALADDPDRQRQIPVGWDTDRGNLLLLGIPGSGTTTTLATIALTAAAGLAPDELDLLVLDMGARDLAPLEALPHCTAYVASGAGAREQQVRFLKHVRAELDRRREAGGPHRPMLVLIDGLASLKDEYDDFEGIELMQGLYRAWAEGGPSQMWFAAATTRAKSVPSAIDEVTTQKWLFRLADAYDYGAAGIPKDKAPPAVAGRCVLAGSMLHAHVASPDRPLAEAVAAVAGAHPDATPKPPAVGTLPEHVDVAALEAAQLGEELWRIPAGVAESDLSTAWLESYAGEHVFIGGPPRAGKSTLLLAMRQAIEEGAKQAGREVTVWGVCGRRSPLREAGLARVAVGADELPELVAAARMEDGMLVLLVDDCEQLVDDSGVIQGLIDARGTSLRIVAAGRSGDLKSMYNHWSKAVRKWRCGVLLQPDVDYDGDLLGSPLPRKSPVRITTGRGWMYSSGRQVLVQSAHASDADLG